MPQKTATTRPRPGRSSKSKSRSRSRHRPQERSVPTEATLAAPAEIPKPDLRFVPIGALDPCRFQTRTFPYESDGDDPRLRELAVSIRAEGILQPILVRPQGKRYEIAAGERRLRAAKLAGLEEVPALVRELDDQQLAEVAAIENLQRVDLPPLEAAASVRLLLDQDGWTHADVAERIGKSIATVSRLAKLADLSPAWRAVVADPEHPASAWGVRHLLLVARLVPEVQDEILKLHPNPQDWFWQCAVAEIARRLGEYTHRLAQAPWSPADDALLPEAGSCLACPHRSSRHPGLFDEDPRVPAPEDGKLPPGDRCLDTSCWSRKLRLWLTSREESLRAKHGDSLHIVADWDGRRERDNDTNVVVEWSVKPCKKSTPGAVPCLRVSGGGQLGEFFWGLVKGRDEGDEPPRRLTIGDLRRQLERQRREWFFERMRALCDQAPVPTSERILALYIGLSGSDLRHWNPQSLLDAPDAWRRVSDLEDGGVDEAAVRLWKGLRGRLRERIAILGHFDPERELATDGEGEEAREAVSIRQLVDDELERMSGLLGANLAELHELAAAELPEPDAWQGLGDSAEVPAGLLSDDDDSSTA